eukprot:scaffold1015_cov141-Amphora_coffeaeformis.AAC.1
MLFGKAEQWHFFEENICFHATQHETCNTQRNTQNNATHKATRKTTQHTKQHATLTLQVHDKGNNKNRIRVVE